MKKSTLIIIGIIYIASIVVISVFGLNAVVYKPVIPVTKIECLNESDEFTTVSTNNEGVKVIKVNYRGPADKNDLTVGTVLYLNCRVTPDNATTKGIMFVYNENLTRIEFVKGENGRELGVVLIYGEIYVRVKIMATDGTGVYEEIVIWAI